MANTLNLDDDMDPVEVVQGLERAFGIEITDEEAASWLYVGDIYKGIMARFSSEEGKRCATAMAFYRLRNTVKPTAVRPKTPVESISKKSARVYLNDLRERSGLNCPVPEPSWVGRLGGWAFFGGLALTVVLAVLHIPYAWLGIAISIGSVIAVNLDPSAYGDDCQTFGQLAKKVAALNFGNFVHEGARSSKKVIWSALVGVLSEYSDLPKSQITQETRCLRSQLKRNP